MVRFWLVASASFALIGACAGDHRRMIHRSVHSGSAARAQRPGEIESRLILPFIPGYEGFRKSTRAPDDPALVILRSRVMSEFDRVIVRVQNRLGFDHVVEKGEGGFDAPVPELTYHVLREAVLEFDSSEARQIRLQHLEQIIQREERLWELRRTVASRDAEIEALRTARAAADASIKSLTGSKAAADAEVARLRAELTAAGASAAAVQQTLAARQAELDRALARAGALEAEAAKLRLERDQLSGQMSEKLEAAQRDLAELRKGIAAANETIAKLQADRVALGVELAHAKEEGAKWKQRADDLEKERSSRVAKLRDDTTEVQSRLAEIQRLVKAFAENKPTAEELADLQRRVEDVGLRVKVLTGRIDVEGGLPKEVREMIASVSGTLEGLKQELSKLLK